MQSSLSRRITLVYALCESMRSPGIWSSTDSDAGFSGIELGSPINILINTPELQQVVLGISGLADVAIEHIHMGPQLQVTGFLKNNVIGGFGDVGIFEELVVKQKNFRACLIDEGDTIGV